MHLAAPASPLDRWQEAWADRLNPMLVREMRRALKSNQFVVAFWGALAAGWLVSAWGVMQLQGAGNVLEPGGMFFLGYHAVLDLCLFFPVPLGVFRNMSSEFREQSFEVLAISTLRADRIVLGKLQSGLAQMAIYLSALAPFVFMTLLMGGVGVWGVLSCLFLSCIGSLLLCLWGGMLGSLSKKAGWETFNAVLLVLPAIGLFLADRGAGAELMASEVGVIGVMLGYVACCGAILFFGGAIMLAIAIDQFHPTIPYPRLMDDDLRRTIDRRRTDGLHPFLPVDRRHSAAGSSTPLPSREGAGGGSP